MALGLYQANVALASSTDPDDATVVAAPGSDERIYVHWVAVSVSTGQTSAVVSLEDGAGGGKLVSVDASSPGTGHFEFPVRGLQLSENTLLNATVEGATGVVGRVVVCYEVKGW